MSALEWLTARPVAHRGLHDRARGIIENMPAAVTAAISGNFSIEVDIRRTKASGEAMTHAADGELDRFHRRQRQRAAQPDRRGPARVAFEDAAERISNAQRSMHGFPPGACRW